MIKQIFIILFIIPILADGRIFKRVDHPAIVNKIVITGNETTRDRIIRREIGAIDTVLLDSTRLVAIQKRIYSLDLFHRVDVALEHVARDTFLAINVTERHYLFPYPKIDRVDDDWGKINYGAGLTHQNLYGLNQKVFLEVWTGYNPGYIAIFRSPNLTPLDFVFGVHFFNYSINNRLEPFVEKHNGLQVQLGKRFGLHYNALIFNEYRWIELPQGQTFYPDYSRSNDGLWQYGLKLSVDHRNLTYYPTSGYYLGTTLWRSDWVHQKQPYGMIEFDARKYFSVGKESTIALRFLNVHQTRLQPVHQQLLHGFQYFIRGHYDDIFSGSWLQIYSVSYRLPLLVTKHYDMSPYNLSEYGDEYLKNLPFGISLSLFADSGFLVNSFDAAGFRQMRTGFGAGLLFHLPYINVARIDVATDDKFKNVNIIIDNEVAF
jgi:outer membrane protein assembly factor BamA